MNLLEFIPGVELEQGCPVNPSNSTRYCWGPEGDFWTVFGSEARLLHGHAFTAVVLGVFLVGVLELLERRDKINIHPFWRLFAGVAIVPIVFLILAYLMPVQVYY